VVGKIGSGKSSLLDALVGELHRISGEIFVRNPNNGIGFVKQEPWIQKGTVRDNVSTELILDCRSDRCLKTILVVHRINYLS
jgi:ABC-type transport system involved in cytochrome bd biosynthesis fused ATPase/permease subunit